MIEVTCQLAKTGDSRTTVFVVRITDDKNTDRVLCKEQRNVESSISWLIEIWLIVDFRILLQDLNKNTNTDLEKV